ERCDHGNGVARLAAEESNGVAHITSDRFGPRGLPRVAAFPADALDPAEGAECGRPGLVRRHALAYVAGGLEVDVKLQLGIELSIECAAAKDGLQPPGET